MTHYLVPIEADTMDDIIATCLKETLASLKRDIKKVDETNQGFVFDLDPTEDKIELLAHIQALKLVIDYYGG